MNGCEFFDDQPSGTLPQWATITQVSDFLEIPRDAVRSAVRRAVENDEPWVKKETSEEEKPMYMIDTSHETYKYHEERWKQNRAMRGAFLHNAVAPWPASLFSGRQRDLPLLSQLVHPSKQKYDDAESGLDRWPQFRQWLCAQGIQIFKNILDDEQAHPWQWRWDDLHGKGCDSAEEAIVAALQSQFEAYEEERVKQDSAFFQTLHQEDPQGPPRFLFFFRRNGSRPM